ncbi:helicase RepA family protein [Aeromonas veronii]|jgi:hypothetical protein|uniref:helicase RepA family protein n=1 Tax=Aeromonas TaxID=642 RepID=UPI001C6840A5|nr:MULTISPECIES: helicase RepA family protein [Aeromonas]MEA9419804.1 helicase RepA family protein [Aeromonas caviae]HDX8363387.1 AAA family ATPase [Aeromonas veronii]
MTAATDAPSKTVDRSFLRFADLTDHRVIVLHTGELANRDANVRATLQRVHNEVLLADNPIDPEVEPEQTLFVSTGQLGEIIKIYKVADSDSTKRIIVHQKGALAVDKAKRLICELRKQAPSAEIYLGRHGNNAQPWGLVDVVDLEQSIQQSEERMTTRLPLVRGFTGFDAQASYLIKGYLPAQCAASIYGPSGSFKSFLAVSWACHIATGKPWNGCKVEHGAVLYVVGEGGVGVPRRIRAWTDEYNGCQDVPNVYRVDMPVFMADPLQVAELKIAAAQVRQETGLPVKLIVIDTVARCFGGADENRAADMGAFIAGCDTVKADTGATMLMVHHTGKDVANGARGSSAFKAALDAEFFVSREGDRAQSMILRATKMKDGEPPQDLAFDLKSRIVTYDDEGDEVTSLVVHDIGREPQDPEADGLSPTSKALFQAVKKASGEDGTTTKDKVRKVFQDMFVDGKKPNMSNFARYLKTLDGHGLITISGDEVRLVTLDDAIDE